MNANQNAASEVLHRLQQLREDRTLGTFTLLDEVIALTTVLEETIEELRQLSYAESCRANGIKPD